MDSYLRSKPELHHDFLATLRAERSDITLQAPCDRLPAERGVRADKRVRRPSETCRSFRVWCSSTRPGPKTNWTKTNMTRFYRWVPRGRGLVAKVPHGHWKTATLLAALRNDRRAKPSSMDTSTGATVIHCEAREGIQNTPWSIRDSAISRESGVIGFS
jgi:hypothetical protein